MIRWLKVFIVYIIIEFNKLATLEFSRDRKSMSILVKSPAEKGNLMFIKGAPDYLIEKSKLIMNSKGEAVELKAEDRNRLLEDVKKLAKKGLRTLAVCL